MASQNALIDGDIKANGDDTYVASRGGASAGSIWIEAGHLTGMITV